MSWVEVGGEEENMDKKNIRIEGGRLHTAKKNPNEPQDSGKWKE